MRRSLPLVAAAVALLAGCGGPQVRDLSTAEQDTYRREVAAARGRTPEDWAAYLTAVREMCQLSDKGFGYMVALAADQRSLPGLRVDVQHVCPDRIGPVDAQLRIQEASG